jgi:hypothetical protein
MVHGHRAEGHQGHGGRQGGLLGQGHGHMGGAGVDHATAQVEHRALGGLDHLRGLFDRGDVEARRRIGHHHIGEFLEAHHLVLHVLRHVDQHRARAIGHGDAEGRRNTVSRSLAERTRKLCLVMGMVRP